MVASPNKVKTVVDRHIDDVLSGRIVTGRLARLAVERHVRDLNDGPARGLVFDEEAAAHVINFFGFLSHSKGEWADQTFGLEPWQQFRLWVLFGWKLERNGFRRFRVAYNSMGRKNGKSTEAAGVGDYLFVADDEPGAEIYTAASKMEQARIIHEEAKRMVRKSPYLSEIVKIFHSNMTVLETNSKYQPLGADAKTHDGLNPHGVIIDELHAHPTRLMWDVLDSATGSRRQPLLYAITTAGHDRQSICYEQEDYATKVLEGYQDDSYFAYIARPDDGDDWRDESVWIKANPNLGVSLKMDYLRQRAKKAMAVPGEVNGFMRLHLNMWTEQENRWLPMDKWDACRITFVDDDLRGRPCWAGIDAGSTRDLSAVVLVFPMGDDRFRVLPFFWCSEEAISLRAEEDRRGFQGWVTQGFIEQTPGNKIDNRYIRRKLNELRGIYDIQELNYDGHNFKETAQFLQDEDGFTCVEIPQTVIQLNEPAKKLEALIVEGKLEHDGNPVLRWMAANVCVWTNINGDIRPMKPEHNGKLKVDGIAAAVNGLKRAMLKTDAGSVYDKRDLILL